MSGCQSTPALADALLRSDLAHAIALIEGGVGGLDFVVASAPITKSLRKG